MTTPIHITQRHLFTGHTGSLYALLQNDAQDKVLSAGSDGMVAEWDLRAGGDGVPVARVGHAVYALAYSAAQNLLFCGTSEGAIHVLDNKGKQEVRNLKYHEGPVFDIMISENQNMIFSVDGTGNFCVTSLLDFTLLHKVKTVPQKLRALACDRHEQHVAVGCGNGTVQIFDADSSKAITTISSHREGFSANAVCFHPTEDLLLTGSRDAHLHVHDVKNNYTLITAIPAHNYAIYSIVFSPDGNLFATASRDKSIKIWDTQNLEVLAKIDLANHSGHKNSVNKLLWSAHNKYLVSTGDDRAVMVWEIR